MKRDTDIVGHNAITYGIKKTPTTAQEGVIKDKKETKTQARKQTNYAGGRSLLELTRELQRVNKEIEKIEKRYSEEVDGTTFVLYQNKNSSLSNSLYKLYEKRKTLMHLIKKYPSSEEDKK